MKATVADSAVHGERQLVRFADHEIGECVARVEAGTQRFAGGRRASGCRIGGRAALLRHSRGPLRGKADLDLLHRAVLGSGNDPQPVGILVGDTFTGQCRARLQRQRAILEAADPKRLDPVPPGRLANVLAHAVRHALPRVIGACGGADGIDAVCSGAGCSGSGGGGDGLLAVRTVCMMSV